MYLRYGLLADAVAPGNQGKKNIIGTFTTIFSPDYPCHHPSLSLAIRIEGYHDESGEHNLEIALLDADHQLVGETMVASKFELGEENIPVKGLPLSFEAVLNMQGLLLPKAGVFEFVVRIDGRHIGSIPLYAIKIEQPAT